MGALYKGSGRHGVLLSLVLYRRIVTWQFIGFDRTPTTLTGTFTGMSMFVCGIIGLAVTGLHRLDHRVLHGHRLSSGAR
jgi:K(+)-stimulated pyrophosphate-energized sodium pump